MFQLYRIEQTISRRYIVSSIHTNIELRKDITFRRPDLCVIVKVVIKFVGDFPTLRPLCYSKSRDKSCC